MTKGCVKIDLVSLHNPKVKLPVKAYVLEKLTAPLPAEKINEAHFSHLKNACLADPKFFIPNNIDMILGSDYFFSILLTGQITCARSSLIAQNSIFGFQVSGKLTESLNSNSMLNLHINGTNIDNQLQDFWPKAESNFDEASDGIKAEEKLDSVFNLFKSIKKQFSLPPKSPLRSLHPFIDEHGGRLQNSQLQFNYKHPIILPSQHTISELLIKEQHIAHLHAGPTLLAHVLRQSYWIVGSGKLINKCIRKCLKWNKFKISTTTPQLMGNLPKHRVTLERPFFSCDIDYTSPVLIKCNKGQVTKSTKGYIALFVYLATKAVHIEAVRDLTTDSFIAALRRGAPRHIYSDNGTNFAGARRKLDEIRKLWLSLPTNEAISYYLSKSSIDWHFIPPSSPYLGGDVLLSVPEELPSTSNHRDRWELLQNIKRGFWKKWSSDFLSSLQPRKKWQDAQPNLKEDDIILIKEEGPPGTWPMARVLQVHPGNDGLVRVATAKTKDSVFKRPVHKLHKLPIYPN
ncbi:integrase catalytic domain-containing protein [Trichonephila inaurata madagascariensis]|uniref:Integrase catalytic domain-containing protein n=1 Tax=Trichonephila inaurata madagascariensis TaxID=2747483 RepID=A0A8X6WNA4_9ARAC|nr:integrase catalytic domain-containing protein [Trichonephila inaurata madagascariensis]